MPCRKKKKGENGAVFMYLFCWWEFPRVLCVCVSTQIKNFFLSTRAWNHSRGFPDDSKYALDLKSHKIHVRFWLQKSFVARSNYDVDMDVSKEYPQIIHFNRVFHYKPSILGYPYFRKHPHQYRPPDFFGPVFFLGSLPFLHMDEFLCNHNDMFMMVVYV